MSISSEILPESSAPPVRTPGDSFERVRNLFSSKPFRPHHKFVGGHAQTLAAYVWPRKFDMDDFQREEARFFTIDSNVQIRASCRWQKDRQSVPTMLLFHGLEGSADSRYILGTASKAFHAGFSVIRINLRNCGNTEHLTPTLYNSGLSGDFRVIVNELAHGDELQKIFLVGFSMSGNIALKYAGEESGRTPDALKAICAVSPSVDLFATERAINMRSNWLYRQSFMSSLRKRVRTKNRLFPELYDTRGLWRIRTIRAFDSRYTAHDGGYRDVDDYYTRASSRTMIRHISMPTLIIHAQDDPFIPFEPLRDIYENGKPNILFLAPEHGGHVGFLSDSVEKEFDPCDRFWAENRVVEFCRAIN